MIVLHLYGKYGKQFGKKLVLHVASLAEAIRLLDANFPGKFRELFEKDAFHVCLGEKLGDHVTFDKADQAQLNVRDGSHIHLVPKAMGAAGNMKRKGLGAILLGALLLGASFFFGFMPGIQAGLSLILGGASLLLTPDVKSENEEDAKSYAFNGPTNAHQQGATKPLIYGRVITGSVTAAASIKSINVT